MIPSSSSTALLCFFFWQPVYYRLDDHDFPADSREGRGRFVSVSTHVGHRMTFKVLTDDAKKVVYRSRIRAATSQAPNLRVEPLGGEADPFIRSFPVPSKPGESSDKDSKRSNPAFQPISTFSPEDLIGRAFLMPQEDGQ